MQPMIAIFTPFKCDGRGFDPRGRGLQIEERPSTGRAGDIVGLENPGAGRLQNIVAQAQGLTRRFLALDQNGVADSVAEERADVRRRRQKRVEKVRFAGHSRIVRAILQQDRMARSQLRREQAERRR